MFARFCLCLSVFNYVHGSHADGWGAEKAYNEQHREHLPLAHTASTSIVTARLDRGVIDLPDVQRVGSDGDDSPPKCNHTATNVATTIDVTANSKCCNSRCCDDDKVYDCCC